MRFRGLLTAAALILGAANVANAATIRYASTSTYSGIGTDGGTLPAFDFALGELRSMTFDVRADLFLDAAGTKVPADVQCLDINCGTPIASIGVIYGIDLGPSGSFGLTRFSECEPFSTEPCSYSLSASQTFSDTNVVLSWPDFIETEGFSDPYWWATWDNEGSESGVGGFVTFSVEYEYDAAVVPLPAGMPLIVAGMGLLALFRRRSGAAGR